jgi:hypothetical protein
MTTGTSAASYSASIVLFVKGLIDHAWNWCDSLWQSILAIPVESRVGLFLGVGTFVINWYYQRKRDKRAERMEQAGKLVEVQATDE